MRKQRLDRLLVCRGLADSCAQAQRLIMAGEVRVGGQVSDKPGVAVSVEADIVVATPPRFVSRGGEKLESLLEHSGIDVRGHVVADVGASTGGFTDCLLQRGAGRVYAIDVGYGQLDWGLRNDPRVVVMERTNARYLGELPEPVDLAAIDVSFIPLRKILPSVVGWLRPGGHVVALVKPQFEARRSEVGLGGVVRDPRVHALVLRRVQTVAAGLGLGLRALMPSPLRGRAGNVEFLGWWQLGGEALETGVALEGCLNWVEGASRPRADS